MSLFISFQRQSSALTSANSADSESRIAELSEEVQKLKEEKTTLQERVKKSNEENMNLIDKVRVSFNIIMHYNLKAKKMYSDE